MFSESSEGESHDPSAQRKILPAPKMMHDRNLCRCIGTGAGLGSEALMVCMGSVEEKQKWMELQRSEADEALNQADISYDSAVDNPQQIDECMIRERFNLKLEDEEAAAIRSNKRNTSMSESDISLEKENGSDGEAVNNVTKEDSAVCGMPATASDDEDAICRRTRARYSLASFTLDELETFLQETDDDDDPPNIDDEEEYGKFLAAVLQGGHNDNDEDEDNDADFEIEIEEALESDVDDCPKGRPETRQNRRRKYSSEGKNKSIEHENRPLRPLVLIPSSLMVEQPPNVPLPCIFSPHQKWQLYCLIHEHVQLLIQVFSLTVLEPSKKNIATQVQGLLSEMLNRRDQVLGGSVVSVLDVPPLKFVGKYLDDISTAVQEKMRHYVEASTDLNSEKQPLFPLSSDYSVVASFSPNHRPAKKTLAATLVESSKKQSVALVPKRIADLTRQFYPFFNPALFPHKPPALAVANRVLFTDAEDELLAMGLMEYNTDWKAIQQRFLPCKSKHQIFVRKKNQCSSKAPDNPVKEVRKLKTSPLTEEERDRISEGLTTYKLDWMSIWKLIVPYRDPSLLPRQWHTALGMQKSNKMVDSTLREKRRIYELNRRRNKGKPAENLPVFDKEVKEGEHPGEQNENGEESTENNGEAYVHEAFLADWRPTSSVPVSEVSSSNLNSRCLPTSAISRALGGGPNCSTSTSAINQSTFICYSTPYRASKRSKTQQVRLAPSLPPVNLPSSVRVIPQAAYQNSHHAISNQKGGTITPSCSGNQSVDEENGNDLDLQMHPLLFQAPGNGHLPYYPLSSGTTAPNSLSFFPMTPHQVNIPAFQNSIQAGALVASKKTSSVSMDFHPLLQRNDNVHTSSSVGAANEPDLEINLNSVPRKDKDSVTNGIEGFKDIADDQSLPEIVMEQEELSDSDEDVENVEFEREEMTDSEGEDEEPYPHQILSNQNRQQTGATLNKDDHDNRCDSTTVVADEVVRSPWLSLNSHANYPVSN